MVSVYTRHAADCAKAKNKDWRRCRCPKWISGTHDGELVRKSTSEGYKFLDEIDLDALLLFRDTWIDGPLAKRKKQERLIGFFWACVRRGYITENPTFGLGKIKVDQTPTDYFPAQEFDRIVDATYAYRENRGEAGNTNSTRLRVMTLLMRWSGLRIRDAVTLERSRLQGDSLLLYQAKTGTPVYVPLPSHLVEALRNVPILAETEPALFLLEQQRFV